MERENSAGLIIQKEFPALAYRCDTEGTKGVLTLVQNFTNYTMEQILAENEKEIEHCFSVAQQMLLSGSNITRLAIRQLFLHNVGSLLEVSFSVSDSIRGLFKKMFGKEYEAPFSPIPHHKECEAPFSPVPHQTH